MQRQYKTIEEFKHAKKHPIIIVLDNIRSLNNVGSFFRTADSFLLEAIYLCGITGKPPHREIEKTALGATQAVEWRYFYDTKDALMELKKQHYKVFGVEQSENSEYLQNVQVDKNDKIALIFGNEVNGIGRDVLELCDKIIEIPQMGTKHSLNVAVCGGIVCWEILRKMKVLEEGMKYPDKS
ncbi:MAG: RNA methyltransferase [Bacteroidia bacterium]|nr:MAG: RNA methyltransferase [Bacteroidia bacterium]